MMLSKIFLWTLTKDDNHQSKRATFMNVGYMVINGNIFYGTLALRKALLLCGNFRKFRQVY